MTLYSAIKVVYCGWHLKRVRECFVVFERNILKQAKKMLLHPVHVTGRAQYQSMVIRKSTSSQ